MISLFALVLAVMAIGLSCMTMYQSAHLDRQANDLKQRLDALDRDLRD